MKKLMLLFVLSTVGCQKKTETQEKLINGPWIMNIAGDWSGTYQTNFVPSTPINISLNQTYNQLTGTWNDGGPNHMLEGTVTENKVIVTTDFTQNGCAQSLKGSGYVFNDGHILLTLSGTSCQGNVSGSIRVERS